jgi:hypothetical protein
LSWAGKTTPERGRHARVQLDIWHVQPGAVGHNDFCGPRRLGTAAASSGNACGVDFNRSRPLRGTSGRINPAGLTGTQNVMPEKLI